MIRADYHFHTDASYDSRIGAAEVIERALEARLDLLCVTDHDTIAGAEQLVGKRCPGLEIVVGCEFTCDDGSHVIGLGLRDMVAERRLPALLRALKRQGAVVLLPHPFRRGSGIFRRELRRPPGFVEEVLSLTDLVECFNGRDSFEHNARSRALALERGLPSVAGSDAHRPAELGSVFVEYDGPGFEHGVSPRRIFHSPQPPATEHRLKRAVMEVFHRTKGRFPPAVEAAYRALRSRLHRDAPRTTGALPRMHHAFPETPRLSPSCDGPAASLAAARGEAGV